MNRFRDIAFMPLRRGIAAVMAAGYMILSLFAAGNFVLCAHENGNVYLESAKPASTQAMTAAPIGNPAAEPDDCDTNDCSDTVLGGYSIAAKSLKGDADQPAAVSVIALTALSRAALAHQGWRSGPPDVPAHHYTARLKPTIVLQV